MFLVGGARECTMYSSPNVCIYLYHDLRWAEMLANHLGSKQCSPRCQRFCNQWRWSCREWRIRIPCFWAQQNWRCHVDWDSDVRWDSGGISGQNCVWYICFGQTKKLLAPHVHYGTWKNSQPLHIFCSVFWMSSVTIEDISVCHKIFVHLARHSSRGIFWERTQHYSTNNSGRGIEITLGHSSSIVFEAMLCIFLSVDVTRRNVWFAERKIRSGTDTLEENVEWREMGRT